VRHVVKALLFAVVGGAGLLALPTLARAARLRRAEPVRAAERSRPTSSRSSLEARGAPAPVLLTMPNYHGTLAAVRSLGRHGIPVVTADPSPFAVANWSKYTSASLRCPPVRDTDRFLRWLLDYGGSAERHVLLPTRYRDELAPHFYMSVPGVSTLHQLLNKRLLSEHARRVGLATPPSWFPDSEADVEKLASETRFPVVVKPVTQVLFTSGTKGLRVDAREHLVAAYRHIAAVAHGQVLLDYDRSVAQPMVQTFFGEANRSLYSIAGHLRSGRVVGARAARKLLQKPRQLGIGLCFEEAPLEHELVGALERLAERVGYSGMFEAEFIDDGRRKMLIDFNPRFYSQMGFDVARGLPLPLLAYGDALGRSSPAPETPATTGRVYAYGFGLKLVLRLQRISGALSGDEARAWLTWYESQKSNRVDAVDDPDDSLPRWMDAARLISDWFRHPRKLIATAAGK
jgi:D-aspartate ligase